MRCIECEEIELARVSDARPSQKMPVPYAALDGFPAGRTPRDLTRRRLLQWGVAGMASVYGAKELGWDDDLGVGRAAANAAEEKCLVLLYLAGGNDGLNVLIPNDPVDWESYRAARPEIHRMRGPATPAPASARWRCPARAAPRSRSRTSSSPAPATTATRSTGSTSSTATAPAAPARTSRSCPRSTPSSTT